MRDGITCFSNGCCNIVGRLVETALWPWSFVWKVLGGRVSPDARVALSRKIPGRFTGIVWLCRKPFGPKPGIQHHGRGRGVPTLTWEEVTIIREGKRRCCSCTKMEIMSLRLAEEMIFSLCASSCANRVGFYTIPYIQAHILGVGSANARKCNFWCQKESYHIKDHFVCDSCWMAIG